jgi:hypothetical protein
MGVGYVCGCFGIRVLFMAVRPYAKLPRCFRGRCAMWGLSGYTRTFKLGGVCSWQSKTFAVIWTQRQAMALGGWYRGCPVHPLGICS